MGDARGVIGQIFKDDPAKQQALAVSIQSISERFFHDNEVTFDYLLTRARKV